MPEHVSNSNPSPEDRFADALDAITLGVPIPRSGDMSLPGAARSIANIGLPADAFQDDEPVTLDRAAKRRIWADLMRENGGSTTASPVPQSPGAAGSTLAPNPLTARPDAQPKRPRPATGVLRFIPAAQPTSTFLLVVAALVLVGGTFSTLAPNGGNGVFRTVSATEHPAQLAYASPDALPVADACVVDPPVEVSGDPLPNRMYRGAGTVPNLHETYVSNRWEQIVACGPFDGITGEIPVAMMTDRRASEDADPATTAWIVSDEEAWAILGHPLAWHELEEMERIYGAALEANPGVDGDSLVLDTDLGVYRSLADGRVALYSGTYWLTEDGRIERTTNPNTGTLVTVHIFVQQDRQWLYDETLRLCVRLCDGFETSGAPKPQLTIATPDAAGHQWLTPLTEESCTISTPEMTGTPPSAPAVETDPADFLPFTRADEADRIAAATTYLRITSGCEANDDGPLLAEGGDVILGSPGREGTTQSQIDTAQAISNALGYTDPIEIMIANDEALEIEGEDGYTYVQKHFVLLPEDVVQLPDGRLGGMLRIQQTSSNPGIWTLEFPATTLFVTFDEVDGQWTLAESFAVCVGRCEDFWSASETFRQLAATATPAATPVATKR